MLLFGPAEELGEPPPGVEVVDAPVSIAKAEDPVRAVRTTPAASIVLAARAVAEGRAQALVCAGATGAALAAGMFNIKRAHGIYRPALAIPLPVPHHPVTLLDVGASAEARREHLVQFAFMGAALARIVLGRVRAARRRCCPTARRPRAAARWCSRPTPSCASARRRRPRRVRVRRQRRGRRRRLGPSRRDRDRRLHRQHRAEADGGRLADDARASCATPRCPRREAKLGGAAAARRVARRSRGDRSGSQRWRLSARAAATRRRAARALHARRLRPGDPARASAARARTSSRRRTRRSSRRARSGARPCPRLPLACRRRNDPRASADPDPRPPRRRARRRSRRDRRGHPLQGGPRGGFAGSVHARAGARGHLRGAHVRRAGRADPDGGRGGRLRARPRRDRHEER